MSPKRAAELSDSSYNPATPKRNKTKATELLPSPVSLPRNALVTDSTTSMPSTPTPLSRFSDSFGTSESFVKPIASNSQTLASNSRVTLNTSTRTGHDISLNDIIVHSKRISNIGATKWEVLTPFVKQLVMAESGEPATFLLFGTLSLSTCGIYGDFVPQFRDTLKKANMKWTLRVPKTHSSFFLKQMDTINKLTETIQIGLLENGLVAQRPVKNDAEFEIRCKLARKRRPGSVIVRPEDIGNERYWQRCSSEGWEPNVSPLGVRSFDGVPQRFEEYANTLVSGTSVVVTARMQAAFFGKEPYVQIVPFKFQVFGTEDFQEETITDIF